MSEDADVDVDSDDSKAKDEERVSSIYTRDDTSNLGMFRGSNVYVQLQYLSASYSDSDTSIGDPS
jgi:hypothetical protein